MKRFFIMILCLSAWLISGLSLQAHGKDIVLGMSADFSGPNSALGIEYYLGAKCFFDRVNASGGVNGRDIVIKAYDDRYNPDPAVSNTIRLVEKDQVFALFNYVGTPTTTRILPLLKYYRNKSVFLFTPLTGADPIAGSEYIYNLRASYDDEIREMVDKLNEAGLTRIAVLHQLDAYGRGGWQSVKNALESYDLTIVAEATYQRNANFSASFDSQVELLKDKNPDAVISIAAYEPAAGFIRDARDNGFDVPILNLSFVNAQKMFELLLSLEKDSDKNYTSGLINSQVVPYYGFKGQDLVLEYFDCLENITPDYPEVTGLGEDNLPVPGSVGFEGYLNARFMFMMLKKMEPEIHREKIPQVIAQLSGSDGPIHFNDFFPQFHGMPRVYFVCFDNQRIDSITDFSGIIN
ncbi:MAG: ABC transporter substrate-binding protein [Desulfonatronovibrio sp.]